tara:strand:+ start:10337 stop:11179 length:843 start_codon:yes stop_codon:yes gene_type:complete
MVNFTVIGANGYVGKSFCKKYEREHELIKVSRRDINCPYHLELEKPEEFKYELIPLDSIVIFTSAISSPEICEKKKKFATKINLEGTSYFINELINRGNKVLFFSSDTVYGERLDSVDEKSLCFPFGEYAKMKYQIESNFLKYDNFRIARLSYVYSRYDNFTKYLINCSKNEIHAEIYSSFVRSFIYLNDLLEGIYNLCSSWDLFDHKIINFGGSKSYSRIEYAKIIKKSWLNNLLIREIPAPENFFQFRPKNIKMHSPKLPIILGRKQFTIDKVFNTNL